MKRTPENLAREAFIRASIEQLRAVEGDRGRTWRVALMAGGGVKGAVTIDPIAHALTGMGGQRFDAFFGTSVGALHASILGSGFENAGQRQRLETCRRIWLELKGNSDIVRVPFPGGLIGKARSLGQGGGIYVFDGLRKILSRHIDWPNLVHIAAPHVAVVTVCLESGSTRAVPASDLQFLKYIIGSAAAPGMAQAEKIDGLTWVDGGVTDVLPFRQALDWAKTVMAPEDHLQFFCFLTGPREPKRLPAIRNGLDVLFRSLELLINAQARMQIDRIQTANDHLLRGSGEQGHLLVDMVVYEPTIYGPPAYDFAPAGIRQLLAHGLTIEPTQGYLTA